MLSDRSIIAIEESDVRLSSRGTVLTPVLEARAFEQREAIKHSSRLPITIECP